MEQILPFSEMKERVNAKRRSVKVAMAALLLTVLGVGGVQAQCTFNASDFTVNASDGSDDMPYDDMVTLNYSGSEALDSIHFIITETSTGLSDSTNVTYDVDESRWYVQFSYLTAGNYTISLRPYCGGQARTLITNGNSWQFTIECTPENATPVIDDIDFEPVCDETTTVTLTVSSTCGSADNYEYYIDDPDWENGADNYDGTYTNVTPGVHTFTVVNVNNSHVADTTITINEQTTCETVLAGSSELSISGFSYEDYDNTGNFGDFYYIVNIPTINGDYVAVEAQYYKIGTTDTNSTYLDMGTGRTTLNIPINAKGDWVVRMRARCCGYNPGNIASDWLLTDTIHHYPNFEVQSVTGACSGNDASASVRFTHPFNISSSNIGVRIFPVDDPSDITFTQTGVSGSMIELVNLAAGDYKMYVYISDGTDENTYNAYLDTTFTIGTRVQVTIENDNARVCENTTDTLRANVSGGTQPYTYQWYYDGDYPDLGDGTNTLAIPTGPSNYVTCIVTDNNNCQAETYIEWEVLPAYTQATQNDYDDYSYDEMNSFHVPQNLCPLNRFGVTFDCSSDSTMDVNFHSVDGCDSIKRIIFTTIYQTGIPGGGILDTTISSGETLNLIDDGGGDGYYSLNSRGKAIVRAAGGERDKLIVYVYGGGALSDEDTLRIYKEESEMAVGYNREGTWNLPGSDTKFMVSSGVTTVNFYTGSKRGSIDDAVGYWKGYRMEQLSISVKSPDQLAVTPICGGSGSVQVTNPTGGVYYCLTNPGGTTDTVFYGGGGEELIFSNLTESGSYTLRSYVKIDGSYESTDHDTTFTLPAGSFELSVEGDSATVCSVNPSVTLTANVSGGTAPYSFQWGTTTVLSTTNECTITEANTTPTLTVTDNSGCAVTYVPTINWVSLIEGSDVDEATFCEGVTSYTWNSSTITISDDHLDGDCYVYYDTVDGAGATCSTVKELHLTKLSNETGEEYVVEWGDHYTWPVNGTDYTSNYGGYQSMDGDCPTIVNYGTAAPEVTRSGVASNGCDSIYKLNLTVLNGIPVPASGTLDTTLIGINHDDTIWVYDNGGNMFTYDLESSGQLVLRAPEGYTFEVVAKEFAMGTGSKVNLFESERDASYRYSNDYFEDNGNRNNIPYVPNTGVLVIQMYQGDNPTQSKGFKLAVTMKAISDTCLAVYDVHDDNDVFGTKTIRWSHMDTNTEGYRVRVGHSNTTLYDTIVTDTIINLPGDWSPRPNGNYWIYLWAVCHDGDTSAPYASSLQNQCGLRPGLADGASYTTPACLNFDAAYVDGEFNMPSCWGRVESVDTINDNPYTFPYIYNIENGDIRMRFNANAGIDHYAVMPKIDTTYGSLDKWVLYFEANRQNTAESIQPCDTIPAKLIVGVAEEGWQYNYNSSSWFQPIDTIDLKTGETSFHYVELSKYTGNGLYPYFMVPAGSGHEAWSIFVDDLVVIPDGGMKTPTNVSVTKHPTDTTKAVVSWTPPTTPSYDDDYSDHYNIGVTDINSGSTTTYTAEWDATNKIINVEAGHNYEISLYYIISSARYGRSWSVTDDVKHPYSVPLYDRMTADTIGVSTTISRENMPFWYGEQSSSEAIYLSSEVNATTIDAIAIRRKPGCNTTGSFQQITLRLADVENETFNVTDNGNGSYTINNGHEFYTEEQQLTTTYTPTTDGWIVFKLNTPFNHDQTKNLLVGFDTYPGDYANQWGNPVEFYLDGSRENAALMLKHQDLSSLSEDYTFDPRSYRPQMIFIQNKNCTPEMHIDTVQVCDNASTDWRDMTISFDDADINLHYVKDSVWDDEEWEWNYNYHWDYYDTIPDGAGTCDSVYKLVIEKLYLQRDGATEKWDYPGEYSSVNAYNATSCGPYTWIDGNTYTESTGYYWDDEGISGCGGYLRYADNLHYDTIEGGASNGCDRIALLNLTVEEYFTVIFDTTGVLDSTAMETPKYVCNTHSYELPECTMVKPHYDFVGWLYDGDTLYVGQADPITVYYGDTIFLTPIWYLNCDGNDSIIDYQDFCVLNSSYTWHGHTVNLAYLRAHAIYNEGWNTNDYDNDGIPYVHLYDTVTLAADGVCDSIYILKVRLEDRFELTDYYSYNSDSYVCPVGITWSDGNHYAADTGWFWWSDPDDSDHYGYPTLDFGTAPMWIDSSANSGCGTLYMLGVQIDSTAQIDTIYFIKNYIEGATSLDTLYSMTMYVCDGVEFIVPDMPDSVTREGYDFEYWTDNPACGWTVDPGESKVLDNDYPIFYGMWQSNCSDTTVYDTITLCSNDTVSWHGITWRGPEFQVGVFDTIVTQYDVIPGECDSIFHLHIALPSAPTLEIDTTIGVTCAGDSDGQISVLVSSGINSIDYNLTYQFKLDTSEYSSVINSANYGWSQLAAGEHRVYVKDGCGLMDSIDVTVTEPDPISLSINSDGGTNVCFDSTTVKQLNADVEGAAGLVTYLWNNDSTRMNDTLLVATNVPGTYTDSLTVTDGNGCTAKAYYTYNVYDTLTVTLNHGDTTYCLNATSVPITVTVTGGDTTSDFIYTWYDHNQDSYNAESLTVPTTTAAEYQYLGVTVSNTCGTKQLTFSVTVLDSIRMWPQVDDVRLCYGANIGQIEVNVQGGGAFTGEWYMNGTAVTDHNPGDAGNKYTPRTDTVGTFAYSLKVTSNAGCGSDSALVKYLTVYDTLVVTATDQSVTYCVNAEADTLRATIVSGSGNYTLQWRRNGSAIADASDTYYVPETTDAGDTSVYTFSVTDNEGCGDTVVTVATITTYESVDITSAGRDTTYCYGATATPLTVNATGGYNNYTYQWYIAGQDTNYIINGASSASYTPPTDSAGVGENSYYVEVTSATCTNDGRGMTIADITVHDTLIVRTGSHDTTYCQGGNPEDLTVTATGGSQSYTFYWYMNGELVATPNSSNTHTPETDSAGTFVYTVKMTDDECGSDSITVATVTVQETLGLATQVDTSYCFGATAEAITLNPTGGNGEYHYTWIVADNSDFMMADTLDIDTNSYTPATDTAREYKVRVQVTSGVCSNEWEVADIYVTEPVRINITTDSNTMCYGTEGNTYDLADLTEGGMGPYTYQWYKDGVEMDGETGDTYMPVGSAAGTFVYSAIAIDEAGCKSDTATVGVLTVSAQLQITSTHDTIIYCESSTANPLTVNVTGGVNYTYEWSIVSGNATLDSNNTSSTYTPSTDITSGYQDTTIYMVTVTEDECDQEASATIATVIVGANLSVAAPYVEYEGEELNNWAGINVCTNNSQKKLEAGWWSDGAMEGAPRPIGFQWYRDGVAIDGADTDTVIIATDSAGSFDYSVALVSSNGCGNDTLHTIVYIDDSLRYSGHLDVPTTLCLGSTVTEANQIQVNTTGGAGTFYYRWYIDGEPVADTATTSNVIMPSTDVAGTYSYSVQITANVCGSDSVHIMDLTVKAPTITYDTMAVCDSLRWINDSLYAIDTNNSSIYQGITTDQTHTVADQYGCDSTVYLHLTVNPSGYFYQGRGGMAPDTMSYCYGSWIDVYTDSQYPEGFAYQWYRDGEAIADATGWRDSTLADTPGTHVYSLKVTPYSGCASDSGAVRVANIYEPFAVNTFQLDTAGCMEDTYLNLPEVDTNATGGCGTSEMRWYEVVGNDTIESNGTVYMDSVGPGEHNYVLMLIDRYECGEGIGINATVTVAEDYTASFVSDEGSIPQSDTTMADLTVCSLNPGLELPENEYVHDMHTFIGWQNTATGDTVQPGDTVVLTDNTTFNTVWRANCQNVDTTQYIDMCFGDTTTWRGLTVTGAQEEYLDTVRGVVDVLCDSIYHLMVNVHYPSTSDTTILACDSVWWNNMFFTETPDTTQSYFMAGGNQYGCDSTAYLNLTVNYSIHDYVVETACDSYVFDNVTYTESADLPTIGAISDNGCPFITHISLTVYHSYHGEDSATACDMYVWNDMELTESGDHDYTGVTVDGCDSVVTLHLTIHETAYGMDTQTACDSLVWIDGNTYFGDFPGNIGEITYTYEGGSMYGCDSVAVLDLTMEDHIYVEFLSDFGDGWMDEIAACVMKPMVMPECGFVNEGFVFSGWLNTVCNDTVHPGDTLYLEESRSYYAIWQPLCEDVIMFTDTAVCEGSSLVWRGQDFSNQLYSGDYEDVVYNAIEDWCDSVFYLRLTVYPVSYNEFFDSVVGSVIWYDEEYTTTGDYSRFCGYNRYGCDSTEVLHLVVNLAIDEKDGVIDVKVYPNPTSGIVNVEGVEIRRIAVLDQVGRTVATFDNTNRIDISDLPAGIYTLYVQTSEGEATRRVMKR